MDRDAEPLRKMVDEGVPDLLDLVLSLRHDKRSVGELSGSRERAPSPCWRLAGREAPWSERELRTRRFRKECEAHGTTSAQPTADAHNRPDLVVKAWLKAHPA